MSKKLSAHVSADLPLEGKQATLQAVTLRNDKNNTVQAQVNVFRGKTIYDCSGSPLYSNGVAGLVKIDILRFTCKSDAADAKIEYNQLSQEVEIILDLNIRHKDTRFKIVPIRPPDFMPSIIINKMAIKFPLLPKTSITIMVSFSKAQGQKNKKK